MTPATAKRKESNRITPEWKAKKVAAIGGFATREARMGMAAKRAGRLGMLKEGKARLFIAGVLPVALYGAEHEPWAEAEIASIEKQAVKALQVRSPGVPHALARLMLPAVADPRFRVHFAAVERWSREIWATAYGYAEQVHGVRRVHKDCAEPPRDNGGMAQDT